MDNTDLISTRQASDWATKVLKKVVTPSNITYLVQYGRVAKHYHNGYSFVSKKELAEYYRKHLINRKIDWKKKLGEDIHWHLSFDSLSEKETTKHVHRLHPYKGKFIPQLVEYFIDQRTDEYKQEAFFQSGDIILDPFCGSGTTLVQANELGIHAIGVDVSFFNTLISNMKITKYDLRELRSVFNRIGVLFKNRVDNSSVVAFERELSEKLSLFNRYYFPTPDYKRNIRLGLIDETPFATERVDEFLSVFNELIEKYDIQIEQDKGDRFLDKWLLKPVRDEINYLLKLVKEVEDEKIRKVLEVVLSKTVRSCRATTHADLATLKAPVKRPYYCKKHGKVCKPLFSSIAWWNRYCQDTLNRMRAFDTLRTDTKQICIQGDSRDINLKENKLTSSLLRGKGINGIFTSPPYIGLIDYHEQHAYSYDLFGYERNDHLEIGPLSKGYGLKAREMYINSIATTLKNCRKYLVDDFNIYIVSNDKYGLYPKIAYLSDMRIKNMYKRPVLNRTEKDKGAYSETIFHMTKK